MIAGFDPYIDDAGEHRWRAVADNHSDIVADSGQGYADARDRDRGAEVAAQQLLRWLIERRGVEHVDALVAAMCRDLEGDPEPPSEPFDDAEGPQ